MEVVPVFFVPICKNSFIEIWAWSVFYLGVWSFSVELDFDCLGAGFCSWSRRRVCGAQSSDLLASNCCYLRQFVMHRESIMSCEVFISWFLANRRIMFNRYGCWIYLILFVFFNRGFLGGPFRVRTSRYLADGIDPAAFGTDWAIRDSSLVIPLRSGCLRRNSDVLGVNCQFKVREIVGSRSIPDSTLPQDTSQENAVGDPRHLHACPQLHHDGGQDCGVA